MHRREGWQAGEALQPAGQRPDQAVYPEEAVARLKARICIIGGEAAACGPDGIASFDLIRYRPHDERVSLRAFVLIEFNGDDLRREALASRKATLAIALTPCREASSGFGPWASARRASFTAAARQAAQQGVPVRP